MSSSSENPPLTLDVLVKIFENLNFGDLLTVRLVSKSWYTASLTSRFLDKIVVQISSYFTPAIGILGESEGFYLHCVLKEVDVKLKSPVDSQWGKFSESLKSLSLHNCDISERDFVTLLESCKHLENIAISGCAGLFMPGNLLNKVEDHQRLKDVFEGLKGFTISSNRYLSDSIFGTLIRLMPNLASLSLCGTQIAFHPAIHRRFYPQSNENLSESVLTFQTILRFLMPLAKSLKSLDFSRTNIDNKSLNSLSTSNIRLTSIYLVSCDQLTSNGIIQFVLNQTGLQIVDISLSTRLNDAAVNAIINNCCELKTISLKGCRELTSLSIRNIHKLSHLSTVNLSRLENIDPPGVSEGLGSGINWNITWLCLASTPVTESEVIKISKTLQQLTYLDLTSCYDGVTDASAASICSNLTKLAILKLAWCEKLSDAGLVGNSDILSTQLCESSDSIAMSGPSSSSQGRVNIMNEGEDIQDIKNRGRIGHAFHKLNISSRFASDLNKIDVQAPGTNLNGPSLSNIRGLREIDFCSCSRVGDFTLIKSFDFNQLTYLNLSLCQKITDAGLMALGPKVTGLMVLFLNQCSSITDVGFCDMIKHLVRLRHLDIQGCKLLGNDTLTAISMHLQNLQYLDVSVCNCMTLEGVEFCEKRLPNLGTIHKRCLKSTKEDN